MKRKVPHTQRTKTTVFALNEFLIPKPTETEDDYYKRMFHYAKSKNLSLDEGAAFLASTMLAFSGQEITEEAVVAKMSMFDEYFKSLSPLQAQIEARDAKKWIEE